MIIESPFLGKDNGVVWGSDSTATRALLHHQYRNREFVPDFGDGGAEDDVL